MGNSTSKKHKYFTNQIVTEEKKEEENSLLNLNLAVLEGPPERKVIWPNKRILAVRENINKNFSNKNLDKIIELLRTKSNSANIENSLLTKQEKNSTVNLNFLSSSSSFTNIASLPLERVSLEHPINSTSSTISKSGPIKAKSENLYNNRFKRNLSGCHVPDIWGNAYYYCPPISRLYTTAITTSTMATIAYDTTPSVTEPSILENLRILVNITSNPSPKKLSTCRLRVGVLAPPFIVCVPSTPEPTSVTVTTNNPITVTQNPCEVMPTIFGISRDCVNSVSMPANVGPNTRASRSIRPSPSISAGAPYRGTSNSTYWDKNSTILTVNNLSNNSTIVRPPKIYKKMITPGGEKLIINGIIYKELLRLVRSSCVKSSLPTCILDLRAIADLSADISNDALNGGAELSSFSSRSKGLILPGQSNREQITKFEKNMVIALAEITQTIEEILTLRDVATVLPGREGLQNYTTPVYSSPSFFLTSPQVIPLGIGNISFLH